MIKKIHSASVLLFDSEYEKIIIADRRGPYRGVRVPSGRMEPYDKSILDTVTESAIELMDKAQKKYNEIHELNQTDAQIEESDVQSEADPSIMEYEAP